MTHERGTIEDYTITEATLGPNEAVGDTYPLLVVTGASKETPTYAGFVFTPDGLKWVGGLDDPAFAPPEPEPVSPVPTPGSTGTSLDLPDLAKEDTDVLAHVNDLTDEQAADLMAALAARQNKGV